MKSLVNLILIMASPLALAGNLTFEVLEEPITNTENSLRYRSGSQFCLHWPELHEATGVNSPQACYAKWMDFPELNLAKGDHSIRKRKPFLIDLDYLMTTEEMNAASSHLYEKLGITLDIQDGKYQPRTATFHPLIGGFLCGRQIPQKNSRYAYLYPAPDEACQVLNRFDVFRIKHLAFNWDQAKLLSEETLLLPFFLRVMSSGRGPVVTDFVLGWVQIHDRGHLPVEVEVLGFDESQFIEGWLQAIPAGFKDWDEVDFHRYQSVLSPTLHRYITQDHRLQEEFQRALQTQQQNLRESQNQLR